MKNYARIINDVAVDVSTDPANSFHPIIAAEFVEVPGQVRPQWRLVGSVWTAPPEPKPVPPPEPEPEPAPDMRITRLAFLNRFLMEERISIRTAASSDPVVADFLSLVDAASWIDLGRTDTQQGIGLLVAKNMLSQSRGDEILTTPINPMERPTV